MPGYGGQLVALDGNDTPIDVASPLIQANQITGGALQNKAAALNLQIQTMQQNALLDYYNSLKGQTSGSANKAAPNPVTTPPPTPSQLIANAATAAQDPQSWDTAMASLAKSGVPEASQFIGHYTPKLKQQVAETYAPTNSSSPPPQVGPEVSPLVSVSPFAGASPLAANGNSPTPQGSPLVSVQAAPQQPAGSPLAGFSPDGSQAPPPAGTGNSPLAMLGVLNPTAASNIANLQARLKFAQTGDINDLRIDPQAMEQVGKGMASMSEAQKTTFMTAADAAGRLAQAALTIPAGPQRDAYVAQGFAQMKKNGLVDPDADLAHSGPATDQVLHQVIARSMAVKDYMEATGQAAGNAAAATLPYDLAKQSHQGQVEIGVNAANQKTNAGYDLVSVRDPTTGAMVQMPKAMAAAKGYITLGAASAAAGTAQAPAAGVKSPVATAAATTGAPNVGSETAGTGGALIGASPTVAPTAPQPTPTLSNPVQGGLPAKPELTPEQTGASEELGKLNGQIISAEAKAPLVMQNAQILRNAATAFRPGATGDERAAGAKLVLDAVQSAGGTPPSWLADMATGADVINKVGGRMTTDLVQSLGTREALGIYSNVQKFMPNVSMSSGGFNAVLGSIEQGAQRDQDLGAFRRQWLGSHSSIDGMTQAFDKAYPREAYASRVWPMPAPSDRSKLIPNVVYRNGAGQSAVWDGSVFHPTGNQ